MPKPVKPPKPPKPGDDDNVINGTRGDDVLTATSENDIINGKSGNDILIYNLGVNAGDTDTFDGGRDSDTVRFEINLDNATEADQLLNIQDAFANEIFDLSGPTNGVVGLTLDSVENLQFELAANVNENDPLAITVANPGENIQLTSGNAGLITIDANLGTITYQADGHDYLSPGDTGQDTFTYEVRDAQGEVLSTATVNVSVLGVNDPPMDITGYYGNVWEDSAPQNFSFISADIDKDILDQQTFTLVDPPAEGSVVNNGDGTFTFDPGTDFQDLDPGETREATFTYTETDVHGATSGLCTAVISVFGVGENTPPVINGDTEGSVYEDGALITNGNLFVYDPDPADNPFFVPGIQPGDYGNFIVDQNGQWVYTLDNELAQPLNSGETVNEVFTVEAQSGSDIVTEDVTITIYGEDEVDNPIDVIK